MSDQRRAVEDEPPFVAADPPHWAARGLTHLLLLLFALCVTASIAVRVPEVVSGRFVLVPVRGTDPLRAGRKGIAAQVRVAQGQTVARNETLFVIRSEPAGDRFAELRTLQARLRSVGERAANVRRQFQSQRRADEEAERALHGRVASLTRTIEVKRKQHALAESLATNYRVGLASKAISAMEYSRPQLEADRLVVEIGEAEEERDATASAIDRLRHEMEGRRVEHDELQRSLAADTQELRIRIAPLEQDALNTSGSDLSILAPCSGAVLRLRVNAAGAVVQDGDVLGEVACASDRLQAELIVPQSGLSLMRVGQGVKLRYDAFPYQRHGVKFGTVRWFGPASVASSDSSIFRALVDVRDSVILVQGQARSLLVGMGGRADVVVGRRSLISYVFEPMRQLRENFAEVPKR